MGIITLCSGCGKERITFGTDAYWRLPPESQEAPRREYLAAQGRRAERLRTSCLRLETVHGLLAARQFGSWSAWAIHAEADPVAAEHVLTLWAKEYALARRHRRRAPRTVEELAAWLLARQNGVTGSWAHPEAPLWLAIGETGEALRLLSAGDVPELKEPPVFLAIVRTAESASEVTARAFELASPAGLADPIRGVAWLPWLRWVTQDLVEWDPQWDAGYRKSCASLLLDTETGGYRCVSGAGMDIISTYRFAVGWNRGEDPLTWLPCPQRMAATIVAAADTLQEGVRAAAASLLVGSLADLDSTAAADVCDVLKGWAGTAEGQAKAASGPTLVHAVDLLHRVGAGNDASRQWLAQFGCPVAVPDPVGLAARLHAGPMPTLVGLQSRVLAARIRRATQP